MASPSIRTPHVGILHTGKGPRTGIGVMGSRYRQQDQDNWYKEQQKRQYEYTDKNTKALSDFLRRS